MGFTHTTGNAGGQAIGYPDSWYTTVTTGASNSYGAWTEIVATSPFYANRMFVTLHLSNPAGGAHLFDIGIGSAGAEVAIIESVPFQPSSSSDIWYLGSVYDFPVPVGLSDRVCVRFKSRGSSVGVGVKIVLVDGQTDALVSPCRCIPIGINNATSTMTVVDPGGSSHTYSAYVEMTAATTEDIRGFILCAGQGTNTAVQDSLWCVDIAVGAAGSETNILSYWTLGANVAKATPKASPIFPIPIPAGSRVSVRAKCAITDASDRVLEIGLMGFV